MGIVPVAEPALIPYHSGDFGIVGRDRVRLMVIVLYYPLTLLRSLEMNSCHWSLCGMLSITMSVTLQSDRPWDGVPQHGPSEKTYFASAT